MKMDIWLPTANPFCTPELLETLGRLAEERGVGTIWVGEHVVLFDEYESLYPYAENGRIPAPPGTGLLEPFTTLSFLAAQTNSVRLGTAMCLLPQRNPVYVAKEVATVDWLSGGRVDLGVGVGWLEEEFDTLNVPWPKRGQRTDEYIGVLKSLWCDEVSEFQGELFTLRSCSMYPKPVQEPHPPIHIGGESGAALRRVARHGQGWHTCDRLPEDLPEPLERLGKLLEAEGRRREDVTVTVCPYFKPLDADRVTRYGEAGADSVAAMVFVTEPAELEPALDALAPCFEAAAAVG